MSFTEAMKRRLTGPVKEGFRKNRILFPQTSIFCSKSSSNYWISFDICLAKFYFEGSYFYYIFFSYFLILARASKILFL